MRYAPLLIGLALVCTVPAIGQALKGHDAKSPVDVEADRIEVQDRADRAVFSGNVVVRQSNLTLTASRLTVAYARADGGVTIERLDASGGVSVKSPSETARGDFAVYDLNRRIITLVGGVELTQGNNRVQGGRMVIDMDTGRATVDGRSAPGTGNSGRVTGRFTVANTKK